MMNQSKPTVVSVRSVMVFWFCVGPTSKRWFLKTIQVNVKDDPLDAMYESV